MTAREKAIPAWAPCQCCQDFICNIHGGHASECPCPALEDWDQELGINPYLDGGGLTPETLSNLCRKHGVSLST